VLHLDEDAVAARGGERRELAVLRSARCGWDISILFMSMLFEVDGSLPLASMSEAMAAEPSGWVLGEDGAVGLDEGCVTRHAQVGLHVWGSACRRR